MSSKVLLHTPCDGCGKISYSTFTDDYRGMPRRINGSTRQIEIRQHEDKVLCQACLSFCLYPPNQPIQLDMFTEEIFTIDNENKS